MIELARRRVAFVVNNLDVGGLEKVVLELVRRLDRRQFEPLLVCLDGKGTLFSDANIGPSNVLVLEKSQARRFGPVKFDPAMLFRLAKFFRDNRVDVVHAHNASPLIYAGISAWTCLPRPRIVYSEHNQIYSASPFSRRKFRHYVKLADRVVAVSNDLRTTLREKVRIAGPIHVIHNGVDGSRFTRRLGGEMRARFGYSETDVLVGCAVVLSEQKGLTYLLDAATRVTRVNQRVRFLIAGDGPLRAALEEKARNLGLEHSVRFLGCRNDVPEFLSALDIYVLPSLWEGLPLALIEALAVGKPIVATSVGGNAEVVVDEVNGFLVAPREPVSLADALLRCIRDDRFRVAVSDVNRARFERCFSVEAMVRKHEQVYMSLRGAT